MNVMARLNDLRDSLPGCSLAAFGDLFSQITLCVSSQDKHPQERLDALCVTAGNLLNGPAALSAANALGMPDESALQQAIVLGPSDLQIFLRSPQEDADVLCCVCSLSSDVALISARAREALGQIAQIQ